jgi:hypothetical protein
MPPDRIFETCKLEHAALRRELNQLKWCQIQFFTFAISATVVVLGLIFKNTGELNLYYFDNNLVGLICLLPLLFLIPSLWIFLDTARTISRIVGYHFWLEDILLGRRGSDTVQFHGWETALTILRDNVRQLEQQADPPGEDARVRAIRKDLMGYNTNFLRLKESNLAVFQSIRGYLVAGYVTFAAFIVLCAFPFLYFIQRHGAGIFAMNLLFNTLGLLIVIFAFFVIFWEFATLKHLIFGRFSDKANRIKWRIAFDR